MLTNQNFQMIKEAVPTDEKGNLPLGEEAKLTVYRVLLNDSGQILLDPIAEKEKWLWQNSEALAMVKKGIQQAAMGEIYDLGSFAEYADLEIED